MGIEDDKELTGHEAPPMANGEIIFEAPWQSRVFGMARALCEQGYYEWDEFREQLITDISAWDETHEASEPYAYFDHFLNALTALLEQKGLCEGSELANRTSEFAARPHGHDH